MIQVEFAERAKKILQADKDVIGLAVGGSWLTNELDEFSDLDLILVTRDKISGSKDKMLEYANRLGNLLSGFTGEHIGEPRVLICLYDNPLLHVDIKFLTLAEVHTRVENPTILLDPYGQLQEALNTSSAQFPYPDYQWIEDRFWIWVHYALLKIGRGEYLEAFDFFGFLRMVVLGPLLHIKNGNLPRGVRKAERDLEQEDLALLRQTIPGYERQALLDSLQQAVALYRKLRTALYEDIRLQENTEEKVMRYFEEIQAKEK
ncbi:aminoglycoside 6-adenylyltransferase [Rufibacter latericius]|uniref:Nucleotidyltransferase domain-containing protein n=1 Tax=Rufibacter latericius TaxID=2487040 RepID=A0A3M9M880_9BACT|nr:aminoglycoside 6-adenylyltransferase [Rufibacter latericius]RNI21790.1 nucleotidyltransferase domain-containing protein [Rufibacter latericius]